MLAVVSPAKKLDFDPVSLQLKPTKPRLNKDTRELLTTAKDLSASDLARLMKLSPTLARLNHRRFQSLVGLGEEKPEAPKPAALAFAGDTYQGLRAWEFDEADLKFAQVHLRILSGLYGVLRPLDVIQPYRLEMGTRLKTPRGNSLYEFWGDKLALALRKDAEQQKTPLIINLASNEYFTAANTKKLGVPVLTCVFKEVKNGTAKVIGFSAKRARGMMARHIVRERLEEPKGLQSFREGGYRFDAKQSSEADWVFCRKHG